MVRNFWKSFPVKGPISFNFHPKFWIIAPFNLLKWLTTAMSRNIYHELKFAYGLQCLHLHNIIVTQHPAVSCLGNYEEFSHLNGVKMRNVWGKWNSFLKLDADVLGALKVVTVLYNSRRQLYWKINLNNCMELLHEELDLVILANIQASTFIEISGEKQKWSPRCSFTFQGRTICKEMFLIL